MKNKSVNMKKLIATPFLFCLSLFTFQVQAQESVDVLIRDNGTERKESIELPPSMTYPLDNDWKAKNYIDLGKDCSTSTENPFFSDSVYIDRLSRIPAVMEMPYNEIVRKFIDMYTGRLRNNVSFMLSACNFYMPIFEEALDTSDTCPLSNPLSTLPPVHAQALADCGSSCWLPEKCMAWKATVSLTNAAIQSRPPGLPPVI